jgi:ribosome biogenesis protein ENP2
MHGYFVDLRLYEKAKSIANPFAYEEYREKQRAAKLEAERTSRIRAVDAAKTATKVNPRLARRLAAATDADNMIADELDSSGDEMKTARTRKGEKKMKKVVSLLTDDRFKDLFQDPDFEIDEGSAEFRLHHPSAATNQH